MTEQQDQRVAEVVAIEREPLLRAMDQLVMAVAAHWGTGSVEHGIIRDVDGLIRKLPTIIAYQPASLLSNKDQ